MVNGYMVAPAVLRLKYYRHIIKKARYSSKVVFYRDNYVCSYCGKNFVKSKLTIDHIIPRSKGGKTDWMNCVTCCKGCNNRKRNRTPEEAGMPLLTKPFVPQSLIKNELSGIRPVHSEWLNYLF